MRLSVFAMVGNLLVTSWGLQIASLITSFLAVVIGLSFIFLRQVGQENKNHDGIKNIRNSIARESIIG